MSNINFLIIKLRKYAFLLFLFPVIGILGSLIFHNILVSYDYKYEISPNGKGKNTLSKVTCNFENNFCSENKWIESNKLDSCSENLMQSSYIINGLIIKHGVFTQGEETNTNDNVIIEKLIKYFSKKLENESLLGMQSSDKIKFLEQQKIERKFSNLNSIYTLNIDCIKNFNYYKVYQKIPFAFNWISKLKKNNNYAPGTSDVVYPFLYGEASISNIVKRFPVNYFFKPLLFISSFLMMMYWLLYQKMFNIFEKEKKINKFLIFGVASSIFLFFHVLLLGTSIENEILEKLRRLIIILFIFCELTAQFFLAKRIFLTRKLIENLTFRKIIYLKIGFVVAILLISIVIILALIMINLPSNVDYFLEWNYFLLLLFFYLLSAMMWKNPITHH